MSFFHIIGGTKRVMAGNRSDRVVASKQISGRGDRFCISSSKKNDWAPWSSPRVPRRVQSQGKTKTSTPDLKPKLVAFKLARGSLMPEMGPLITHIGRLRRVYGPLRFKNCRIVSLSDLGCALCDYNITLV